METRAGIELPVPMTPPPGADHALAEHGYFNDAYLLAPVSYFLIASDTTIVRMNVVAAELLGLQRGNPERLLLRQFIAPRFLEDFDRFMRRSLRSVEPVSCKMQMVRARNQQGFPVTLRASSDVDGNTLRIMAEPAEGSLAALERSEERFRRIVHSADEGIWEIDANARTSFVNPKLARMLGYGIEEMLDQPLLSFMDDEGRAILERNIALRQRGTDERHTYKFRRKDGGELWATLATNPLFDGDGGYLGALALVTDVTASRASAELIWHQANFDALTSLPNRHMFLDRLGQELKKARREGGLLALLFIDLDGFKQVNDSLGHAQGDVLLAEAARRIGACVRGADTLARLGGDEFTVILPGLDQVAAIDRIAQAMLARLAQPFVLEGDSPVISASIGVALFPADAAEAGQLLHQADQAMYAAKHGGRNRYSYFTPDLQLAAQARQQITEELRQALELGQLELYYQPIVNLGSGKIERAEALLRWRHPLRGLLTPTEFLPFAVAGGMMMAIGDWVFRQAADQTHRWQRELAPGFQVAINQSPAQFRGDTTLYVGWLSHVAQLGLSPRSIVIEITERVLLDDTRQVAQRLRELREMGLQVALDNFGNGQASLSHLKRAGIDLLKLDGSLVANLAGDSGDLAMCEALIVMAHKLGLRVVAEGVETAAQARLLQRAGCDFAQGYAYAPALPAAQFGELARRGLAAAEGELDDHPEAQQGG